MPYVNIENKKEDLLDYSFWYLPDHSKNKLFTNVKRIDLKELYATIYLNLFHLGVINKDTEPHISNNITLIERWKKTKNNISEDEKKQFIIKINSLYTKGLNNKYLLHQVLRNLHTPILDQVIYIDTDVLYLESISPEIISHLNCVYGSCPSELTIKDIDFLYIVRHKLIAEQSSNVVTTNLDRLVIHRQNNTVKSKIVSDNENLKIDFALLIRDFKINQLLEID